MGRLLLTVGILVLACTIALPAASKASSAQATARSKCKHRPRHKRKHKRCRKQTGAAPAPTAPGASETNPAGGPPGRLLVTEREISPTQLRLQLSRPSLAAGTSIIEQYNAGSDAHNLIAERESFVAFAFSTLDPGGDQRQAVSLSRGTYTLYCSILDHRTLGMEAKLSVN
jgi:hypothetical protein